ncbi:hypothetical protein Y032_0034g2927 [Ancylostoma ceylanicum]|uniref:Uncharacterized protein n=1 Tax=Ancylostoma ceylanicum TaxID=53326 RepID=A0A016UN72_9BILA|nr:hypothetical protein Y032_0034g2927 [Ancylostoma ceylanicum]
MLKNPQSWRSIAWPRSARATERDVSWRVQDWARVSSTAAQSIPAPPAKDESTKPYEGLDYYHDLITGHVTKTPSGLHVAKTVFGPTIYGSGSTEVSQIESVNYNLTAVWENTKYLAPQKSSELGELGTPSEERRKGGESLKYSDEHTKEVFHAYGFTTSSFPLEEAATDVAKHHSVAKRRLQSPRLQPSPANRSRHRPVLPAKPPFIPSSRRSPPAPAIRRHLPRPRAAHRHRPRQEVDRRITS